MHTGAANTGVRKGRKPHGKLPAISLFAGAGGLDVGVDAAGLRTICAVEFHSHCVSTLRRNARGKTVWQVDVRALDPTGVTASLNLKPGDLALLHGGPPCQPFSQIGKKGGIGDPRGQLAFQMVRFADGLRPAAVLIEQVPKFLDAPATADMTMVDALSEELARIGYAVRANLLHAGDYGVAQKRKRAIIVAVPEGQAFDFPLVRAQRPPTVGDAIGDLPQATPPDQDPLVPNHIDVTPPRDRLRESRHASRAFPTGTCSSARFGEGRAPSATSTSTARSPTRFRHPWQGRPRPQ